MVGIGIRLAQDVGAHRRKMYTSSKLTVDDELWKRAFWWISLWHPFDYMPYLVSSLGVWWLSIGSLARHWEGLVPSRMKSKFILIKCSSYNSFWNFQLWPWLPSWGRRWVLGRPRPQKGIRSTPRQTIHYLLLRVISETQPDPCFCVTNHCEFVYSKSTPRFLILPPTPTVLHQ